MQIFTLKHKVIETLEGVVAKFKIDLNNHKDNQDKAKSFNLKLDSFLNQTKETLIKFEEYLLKNFFNDDAHSEDKATFSLRQHLKLPGVKLKSIEDDISFKEVVENLEILLKSFLDSYQSYPHKANSKGLWDLIFTSLNGDAWSEFKEYTNNNIIQVSLNKKLRDSLNNFVKDYELVINSKFYQSQIEILDNSPAKIEKLTEENSKLKKLLEELGKQIKEESAIEVLCEKFGIKLNLDDSQEFNDKPSFKFDEFDSTLTGHYSDDASTL